MPTTAGDLFALDARSGRARWHFHADATVNGSPAHGGSFDANGVTVGGGMLFVTSGYGLWGGTPGNVLLAFSLDRR